MGWGAGESSTIPATTCASLKPRSPWSRCQTLLHCGLALFALLCWGNTARCWSHRGLCPQNTRQPRQDINTNSSKGVPWSWWPCAGHRNLISHFVTRTGTNGGCGGSWACVTGCWRQPDLRAVELLFKLNIAQNSHCWVMCENVSATPAWGKEQSDSAG